MLVKKIIPSFIKKKIHDYVDERIKMYVENDRFRKLEAAIDFCCYNKIPGNYLEFGVFGGNTFQHVFHYAQKRKLFDMHFYAFDSFQGFSKPIGNDDVGIIKQSGRTCSEKQFIDNMSKDYVDLNKVTVVPGWFSDVLTEETKNNIKLKNKSSLVFIDCDLYEPTIDSLNFITDLVVDGTVLIFDNFFYLKANPDRGERKAFTEWKKQNPHIRVTEFLNVGWHGKAFILNFIH